MYRHPHSFRFFFHIAYHRIFEKIKKNEKPSVRLIKKKKRKDSMKSEMKREVMMYITEIQRLIRDYHKQLHANKMDNLEEMEKILIL